MARSFNKIVFVANFVALLIAIAIICGGFYLKKKYSNECQGGLAVVIIVLGFALLILSSLGIFGSCCRLNIFICIYIIVMFLLIICVIIHMVISFVSSSNLVNVFDYRLDSSPGSVEKSIVRAWNDTEKCFKGQRFCNSEKLQKLHEKRNSTGFLEDSPSFRKLYSIEIGCCQPPSECGFIYVNATHWETPKTGITSANKDCKVWGNKDTQMCYECDSCKVGVIASTQSEAADGGIISVVALLYLLINLAVGFCALLENRTSKRQLL